MEEDHEERGSVAAGALHLDTGVKGQPVADQGSKSERGLWEVHDGGPPDAGPVVEGPRGGRRWQAQDVVEGRQRL